MSETSLMEPWFSASEAVPLDFSGPVEVAFERFEEAWVEQPIISRFEQIAGRHADRIAVDDGTQRLTYRALYGVACELARRIDALVPARRPVGILLPHKVLFPPAVLACLALERPYVPIDPNFPPARIQDVILEAGLAGIIVEAGVATVGLPLTLPQIAISAEMIAADAAPVLTAFPATSGAVDAPAVILYTSGSTGRPKGICNNQRSILQRVAESTNSCHVHADDRFMLLSSTGTIAGVREMLTALLNGAALHMADPHERGIHGVLDGLRDGRITICYIVPALLRALLRAPNAQQAFASLRVARVGGDITLESDLALFRSVAPATCYFFASFSSTEMPAAFQWFVPSDWQPDGLRLPVGYLRPGIECMVINEQGAPLAAGEPGELVVRSRYLALGHWQAGGLQPGPFVTDADDPALRTLRTGDMLRQRQDGLWDLIGRRDRQLKIRGQRVDPGEVEAVLRACDGVVDAAVIARRDGAEASALVAYVVPAPEAGMAIVDRLWVRLAEHLPQHMRPTTIRCLEAIPQLRGFKPDIPALERIDREQLERARAIPLPNLGAASPTRITSTNSAVQVVDAVRHAWSGVLDARSFQADLRWDQTGGDSLKALQLWFQIEERLGRKLPLDVLAESATPSALIAAIERHLNGADCYADPKGGAAPIVFLMPGIAGDEPLLMHFRGACGDHVRFKTLSYPDWREMMDAGANFAAIIDAVVEQICAEPACDAYRLAGYSFGGFVAYETARRLIKAGRTVRFLGLLDSRRWDLARFSQRYRALLADPARVPSAMLRLGLALFVSRRWFVPLGAAAQIAIGRPTGFSFAFRQHLNDKLRLGALRSWMLAPLDVPTTLFLSDDRLPGAPLDYGWGALCRNLNVVHIGGSHASMMESPLRDLLCSRFLEAL